MLIDVCKVGPFPPPSKWVLGSNLKHFCKSRLKGADEEEWSSNIHEKASSDVPTTTTSALPSQNKTPDIQSDEEKDNSETIEQQIAPRIRLKANLATDPAQHFNHVSSSLNLKLDIDSSHGPNEYLNQLPAAVQSALARGFFLPAVVPTSVESTTLPDLSDINRPPHFICPPCGIRFSSMSTLEAHQTFYCSHRANKTADEDSKSLSGNEPVGSQTEVDPSEPCTKNVRSGKQYTCTHCSYSADKKVSLNRHMRMHTVSPSPANVSAPESDNNDRYCAECDIRFSSQKTFRAHKLHYCNSRHIVKQQTAPTLPAKTTSSCTSGSSPTSPVDPATCRTPPSPNGQLPTQQPFLALPTNPIIIVPYSLFRSASVLPAFLPVTTGLPNPDTPCFLLPNGTLQPMTQAISNKTTGEVLKMANKSKDLSTITRETNSAPLDLSIRKSPDLISLSIDIGNDNEKENLKQFSPSPEKIECVPSLHGSPPSTPVSQSAMSPPSSISPKRKHENETSRSSSPRLPRLSIKSGEAEMLNPSPDSNNIPFDITASLHPLLMRAGSLALFTPEVQMRLAELPSVSSVAPQVLVKQGVSKCKECNIVFCKHENYVIHKKHYCSARTVDDDVSKTSSASPPISPRSSETTSPAGQYQQLICVACGIKFTSLDNLNAHQAYYCLKRGEIDVRRCGKCRNVMEPGHQCVTPTTLSGWKCPCCDVISPTSSAAQRHMETHAGVKAYRCTICRYKGNTLRGMRTHIRMHFDKRSPDLQEEKYITYILEDDGVHPMEVLGTATPGVTDDREVSPTSESRNVDVLHHCSSCSYSSSYKANVSRHVKMVHYLQPNQETTVNGCIEKIVKNLPIEDDEDVIVKKEAIEPEVIIAPSDEPIKSELMDNPESKDNTSNGVERDEELLQEAAKPGPKYCKSCDISFTYYSTFIAHKKFYCSSHAGEISASTTNNNNNNNNNTRTPAEASVL